MAGHDVEHPWRHARLCSQLGQRERRQRGLLGRLDHHRAPGSQRRRSLAGDHRGGEVPRRDGGADAHRLLQHHDATRGLRRHENLAADALGLLGEPLDEGAGIRHLAPGLRQWLALLEHDQPSEVLGVGGDELGPGPEDRRAVLAGPTAPGGERAVRGLDGVPHLSATHRWHGGDDLPRCGIVDIDRARLADVDPEAVDVRGGADSVGTDRRDRPGSGASSSPTSPRV